MPGRLVVLCLFLAVSAACDGTIPRPGAMGPPPDAATASPFVPRDGSRLKARWLEGPGGQRTFEGFHDAGLGSECSVAWAADGELRCLPLAYFLFGEPDWADPACSEPIVWVEQPSCRPTPFVSRIDESNACRWRERVFRVGPATADGRAYHRDRAGACVPYPEDTAFVPHHVGEELAASSFVRMTLAAEPPRAGRPLQLVVLEAEDGARVDAGFRDTAAGRDCYPTLGPDGRTFCAPDAALVSTSRFADPACSEPTVRADPVCEPAPTIARKTTTVEIAPGHCALASTMHEVGPWVERPYLGIPGLCQATPFTPGVAFYAVGPAIPGDRFATFERFTEPSPHRLSRTHLVAPAGTPVIHEWFDREQSAPCTPTTVGGKQRCVPSGARLARVGGAGSAVFADEACTQPLLRATAGACLPRHALGFERGSCPRSEEVYAVGGRHRGLVYEQFFPDGQSAPACRFAVLIAPTDVFHEVTRLPGDEFPELKPIEPRP